MYNSPQNIFIGIDLKIFIFNYSGGFNKSIFELAETKLHNGNYICNFSSKTRRNTSRSAIYIILNLRGDMMNESSDQNDEYKAIRENIFIIKSDREKTNIVNIINVNNTNH